MPLPLKDTINVNKVQKLTPVGVFHSSHAPDACVCEKTGLRKLDLTEKMKRISRDYGHYMILWWLDVLPLLL